MRLVFICAFIFSITAHASVRSPCGDPHEPIQPGVIECLVDSLISRSFPELENAHRAGRIQYREFDSKSYFLKTSILEGKLSRNPNRRVYSIDVNPKIFNPNAFKNGCPTVSAIQGILAHELVHLTDYEVGTPSSLVAIGIEMVVSPAHYERSTDVRAFERGYSSGIKDYRNWIYENLSGRSLRVKKRRYFTPAEIDQWVSEHVSE